MVAIVLVVLVLLGAGWAVDKVDVIAASIDDGLAKVPPLLDRADDGVTRVQERITIVGDAATAVLPRPTSRRRSCSGSGSPHRGLRALYPPPRVVRGRAGPDRVGERPARDARPAAPRREPPAGTVGTLSALDTKVQALDDKIMGILTVNERASRVSDAATAVARKTTDVVASLDEVKVWHQRPRGAARGDPDQGRIDGGQRPAGDHDRAR